MPAVPGRAAQNATRIGFLVAGLAMAIWAPLIPFAKARAQLDDGTLGSLLLCLGIGSFVTMPLAGSLAIRFGCRAVILAASAVVVVTLPALATLSSAAGLMTALLLFGAGLGALDVVVNLQAIIVERASGRTMMSGFHGLFSVGGFIGAALLTVLLAHGAPPLWATAIGLAGIVLALAFAARSLLPYGELAPAPTEGGDTPPRRLFAMPRGLVLRVGLLCCAVFLMEGAMLDWSALYLVGHRDLPQTYGGLGYAAFAATMTIGRLTGDRLVRRLGGQRVMALGAACAAFGVAISAAVPAWPVTLLGFALIGIGCSNIVPVLYSSLGRQQQMPQALAVSAVTTLGYGGILMGPALIGWIAQVTHLGIAFGLLMVMMIVVAANSRIVRAA